MTPPVNPKYTPDAATNLTCQRVTNLIIDYVTDDMEGTLRVAFESHLQDCPDCTAFLNTYRQTIRATRSLRYDDVPQEMLNRVSRFLRQRIEGLSSGC